MPDYDSSVDLGLSPIPNFEDKRISDSFNNIHNALGKLAGNTDEAVESGSADIAALSAYIARLGTVKYASETFVSIFVTDYLMLVNASITDVTMQLPNYFDAINREFVFKVVDKDPGNVIQITGTGGQTIDGNASLLLDIGESVRIKSTSTGWYVIA